MIHWVWLIPAFIMGFATACACLSYYIKQLSYVSGAIAFGTESLG